MTLLLISTEVLSVLRHVALSVLSLDIPCILDELAGCFVQVFEL